MIYQFDGQANKRIANKDVEEEECIKSEIKFNLPKNIVNNKKNCSN